MTHLFSYFPRVVTSWIEHNALHRSWLSLQNDLVETGVASETNARDTINKLCLPLVGERQASFEKLLENMDVSWKL